MDLSSTPPPPPKDLQTPSQLTPKSHTRNPSRSSESSESSQITAASGADRSPFAPRINSARTILNQSHDLPLRAHSPAVSSALSFQNQRPRQHSQGFFEPSISTSSLVANEPLMPNLTASQIAAQAAIQQQNMRKRSQTIPDSSGPQSPPQHQKQKLPVALPHPHSAFVSGAPERPGSQQNNGSAGSGGQKMAAATAASAAFPRSPLSSPNAPVFESVQHTHSSSATDKEGKPAKERSKMKLFSKPKSIGISKEKDVDKKLPPLPSPNKGGIYGSGGFPMSVNSSSVSLVDTTLSSSASFYSSANASTSTLVPSDRNLSTEKDKDKDKHKHNFLSRQKHKLKDKDDHHHLPLSSASSNSRPTDLGNPQPLYSFAPAPTSPGHSSSFAKSVSGLDLRHGGRALREKKKEEKAASALSGSIASSSLLEPGHRDRAHSFDRIERPGTAMSSSVASTSHSGQQTHTSDHSTVAPGLVGLGSAFGVPGLNADDAWPLLKTRLINIFEGEDPRPPIEDFNGLVSVHIRRCIQRRAPTILIEDFRELLHTGFTMLDHALRLVPDERLIPHLVEVWMAVFGTILPFIQAVFLPLDLEFKGRGPILTAREASEFWGATSAETDSDTATLRGSMDGIGDDLDVRRMTLLVFRDTVILPRNDALMAIFSRLSLENINAGVLPSPDMTTSAATFRPGTSASASSLDPKFASYNSQSSTLLDSPGSGPSLGTRSRATSNTLAGSFTSNPGQGTLSLLQLQQQYQQLPQQPMDSTRVTEMVGRMLQCFSVLASVQSADESQSKMERLTKELKYNWLGRGRTGRQRRGFVGTKSSGVGLGLGTTA